MSEKKQTEEHRSDDGVLKSASSGPQRMSEFTNSAVSDIAVARSEVEFHKNEIYVGHTPEVVPNEVYVGSTPEPVSTEAAPVDELQETLKKADAIVESFEQRQAQLAEAYDKAEKMLEEVARIKEALTFDDKLRERIEATIARTKSLRRGVQR